MTISASIVANSIAANGTRIVTFELEYPRFVHAELMTHRVFSRNAASSRAIPVAKSIELINADTAMPIHWGKNMPGMSANEECNERHKEYVDGGLIGDYIKYITREELWLDARDKAIETCKIFKDLGYHKQIVNRLLEPFSHIKVVVTSTEYENFFWLRDHKDAQPEIAKLASIMKNLYDANKPRVLEDGDWHVPYFNDGWWGAKYQTHFEENYVTLEQAIAISSSCCAQVSYRKTDSTLEKAIAIYDRLVGGMPPHFSPFEHQATPIEVGATFESNADITHIDRAGNTWCGNFKNWTQYRQILMQKLKIEPMTSKPPENLV